MRFEIPKLCVLFNVNVFDSPFSLPFLGANNYLNSFQRTTIQLLAKSLFDYFLNCRLASVEFCDGLPEYC